MLWSSIGAAPGGLVGWSAGLSRGIPSIGKTVDVFLFGNHNLLHKNDETIPYGAYSFFFSCRLDRVNLR